MGYQTVQETFWAGEIGNNYIDRTKTETALTSKIALWSRMLKSAHNVGSALELGCNIGLNLLAIHRLNPDVRLNGIEINEQASQQATALDIAEITQGTILEDINAEQVDLTFTAGVLIHINPNNLKSVYANLVKYSRRYVLVAEYYNPAPVSIPYRGHSDRLFKRDFAGDLIEQYGLKLVDYGFVYRRDNCAPQDDITWFLMEK